MKISKNVYFLLPSVLLNTWRVCHYRFFKVLYKFLQTTILLLEILDV